MCAMQRSSNGAPNMPTRQLSPANLSSDRLANRRAMSSWSAARTLIAKCWLLMKPCRLGALLSTQNSTSGGSSETEANEFAVRPYRSPLSSVVVTTVTPVVKAPTACLKSQLSSGPARIRDGPGMTPPHELARHELAPHEWLRMNCLG